MPLQVDPYPLLTYDGSKTKKEKVGKRRNKIQLTMKVIWRILNYVGNGKHSNISYYFCTLHSKKYF